MYQVGSWLLLVLVPASSFPSFCYYCRFALIETSASTTNPSANAQPQTLTTKVKYLHVARQAQDVLHRATLAGEAEVRGGNGLGLLVYPLLRMYHIAVLKCHMIATIDWLMNARHDNSRPEGTSHGPGRFYVGM